MTTIAWDGRTLAGDTLCCRGGMTNLVETKVWKLPSGGLYGASGSYDDLLAVRDWLFHGMPDESKPQLKDDSFAGILIASGRCFRLETRLIQQPIVEQFHAVGNGRDFAMAAMRLGRSAKEAVQLAIEFDAYTGGTVVELTLDT